MASDDEMEIVKEKKPKKEKKEKKDKKKKKAGGDEDDFTETENSEVVGDVASPESKKKKKKSLKKPGDNEDLNSSATNLLLPETKKKKKKSPTGETDNEDVPETTPLASPESKKKKKKKHIDGNGDIPPVDASSEALSPSPKKKLSGVDKYSVDYFEALLQEVKEKCEKKIKIKSRDRDAFLEGCAGYHETWYSKYENEQWLNDLLEKDAPKEQIEEAQKYVDESTSSLPQHRNYCIGKALEIFQQLDEDKLAALEDKLVKGAIIAQASPTKLAEFASKSKEDEHLLKRLFSRPKLMKRMLQFGGAAKYEYGNAMRIYTECVGEDEDDDEDDRPVLEDDDEEYDEAKEKERAWARVNRKIALACALELAAPIYEFDTSTPVDAVGRYSHFERAHRKGELDPAFPFFSVWEMRQVVNCDAPNDQMEWCRKMVFNYVSLEQRTVLTLPLNLITNLNLACWRISGSSFDVFDR
jgi:hypothetical protein